MRLVNSLNAAVAAVVLGFSSPEALAQQTTVGTPAHSHSDSFFEQHGVSWGLRGPGWFFNFGGSGLATPQFGGFSPGAGASLGWGFGGGPFSGNFNYFGGQGATRSSGMVAPSATMMNGQWAYVADTSISPFVIAVVPVVGGGAPVIGGFGQGMIRPPGLPQQVAAPVVGPSKVQRYLEAMQQGQAAGGGPDPRFVQPLPPGQARKAGGAANGALSADLNLVGAAAASGPAVPDLNSAQGSSASKAVMSVAEARAAHQAEQAESGDSEALIWLERGKGAEAAGKGNVAAIYYRMAARRASGELREQALARLEAVKAETEE